jgi:predicted 3-demethylubiquinone-9 3-methyltransferase (glyoxalase superfamily)
MSNFYNDLYDNSQIKQLKVYIDKTPYDEDDTTILFRMKEYGINYTLTDNATNDFKTIHTDCTITKSYKISY